MTYVKMIDEATGNEITDVDLATFEWNETTVHSTAVDRRTFTRGRRLRAPYQQYAGKSAAITADDVLRYFDLPGCAIERHEFAWDVVETEPVDGYRNYKQGDTGMLLIRVRRKDA